MKDVVYASGLLTYLTGEDPNPIESLRVTSEEIDTIFQAKQAEERMLRATAIAESIMNCITMADRVFTNSVDTADHKAKVLRAVKYGHATNNWLPLANLVGALGNLEDRSHIDPELLKVPTSWEG